MRGERNIERKVLGLIVLSVFIFQFLPSRAQSVVINPDSTIRFQYCGKGKKVKLLGDFHYRHEKTTRYSDHHRSVKMHRTEDGCFETTIRPLYPEMYTYCFRVDGKRVPDPTNLDTAWQKLHMWNVLTVGGDSVMDLYQPAPQEGKVIHTKWYSSKEKLFRRVNVYVPAVYESSTEPLDVLYLIHGINGYEGAWTERGRAKEIMENLAVEGRCRPMLIVMPDVNVGVHEDRPSLHTLWFNVVNYSRLKRDRRIEHSLSDLIEMVDSTYRVTDRIAVAGLSDGARLAANLAQSYPDRVYAVGLFSPVVQKKQMPADSVMSGCPDQPCVEYSIIVGKKDWMFRCNGRRFHKNMTKAAFPHQYEEVKEGHYWRTWREALVLFLEKI